ncbi:MAG TPA: ABC transporter ATP-binding protein, partial [Bacteroidetes bacterium]|nr:ABC transporter ATP-binding protein [Bacteroidota bacterium]
MNAIKITNFHKNYNSVEAVKGIDLAVNSGELFGIIGPDGAGKTTLTRAVCTLLVPDDGTIFVDGKDVVQNVARIRAILGYMPQRFSLYPDLSVEQNLRFFADLFQVPAQEREERLAKLFRFSRLEPFKKRKAEALSGGMKQKLALSCALIHTPKILVLDEPTLGVDPLSRQEFWQILHKIRDEGSTILVTTSYMDEAEQCDRVALFFKGEIVGLDTPENLKNHYPFPIYKIYGGDLRGLKSFFDTLNTVHTSQLFGDALHVSFAEEPSLTDWKAWQAKSG